MLAASPLLIQLLYSSAFEPAVGLLRWQLIGDLLRLPAWVLGFVLLANGRGIRYFTVELVSGATLLIASLIAISVIGLEGAGVAYAVAQAAHLGVLWFAVRNLAETRPGRLQLGLVLLALGSALVISLGAIQPFAVMVFGVMAIALAAAAWPRLLVIHRYGLFN
jgi:PST family polysaccharide transporter